MNKIAKEIAFGLATGGLLVTAMALPNIAQVMKIFKAKSRNEKLRIRRAIESLQKYDLVEVVPGSSYIEQKIRLSRAGKELLEFDSLSLKNLKKWDGKWRVILFDIPEEYSKARRALSLKLRELGCYHYQNSVFIYPHDCSEEIRFIKEFFGVGGFIKIILAERLEEQDKVEDFFKL